MERQPFCCLPWCGRTGKIDMHHLIPRSQGGSDEDWNLAPLCHPCHMKHHSEEHLAFLRDPDGGGLMVLDPTTREYVYCRVYNEFDQSVPFDEPTVPEALGTTGERILELMDAGATCDYYLGRELAEGLESLCDDREALKEWLCDERDFSPKSFGSWLTKRLAYAALPDYAEVRRLGISKGYMVARLVKAGEDLGEVIDALHSMPRSQFDAQYGLAQSAKPRHECPECGATHVKKEGT